MKVNGVRPSCRCVTSSQAVWAVLRVLWLPTRGHCSLESLLSDHRRQLLVFQGAEKRKRENTCYIMRSFRCTNPRDKKRAPIVQCQMSEWLLLHRLSKLQCSTSRSETSNIPWWLNGFFLLFQQSAGRMPMWGGPEGQNITSLRSDWLTMLGCTSAHFHFQQMSHTWMIEAAGI